MKSSAELGLVKLLSESFDADYSKIIAGVVSDKRIGASHTKVPGPDGDYGFGGTCFPKDINAIIEFSKGYDTQMNTLEGAWETNLRVRPEQDWKEFMTADSSLLLEKIHYHLFGVLHNLDWNADWSTSEIVNDYNRTPTFTHYLK